jgi:hypothetical protein
VRIDPEPTADPSGAITLRHVSDRTRPYLLVYDWACGQVMSVVAMSSDDAAAFQRGEVASAYADDPSIEVTVVHAESAAAVSERVR